MNEIGQVVEVKNKNLVVKLRKLEACSKCRACNIFSSFEDVYINATNLCDAKIDDYVKLELAQKKFFSAVIYMYILPMLFMFAGFFLGSKVTIIDSELSGFIVGIIFVIIFYAIVAFFEKNFLNKHKFTPNAIEIVYD